MRNGYVAIATGFLAFALIAGFNILDPRYTSWLYVDNDPFTHQLGWIFFRGSPWTLPLGLNPRYGLDISSSIVYSDSIPLFAILFKSFNALLSDKFQYFGIWTLACFILQAYFGFKLIGLITSDFLLKILSIPFFIFSPIMLNRIGMHTALASHFLILAGLYLSLNPNQKNYLRNWTILLAVCASTHFYLLAITFGLWIASSLDRKKNSFNSWSLNFKEKALTIFCLAAVMWQVGYFTVGLSSAGGGWGYGTWGMNLLSFFNAKGWSYILPPITGVNSHLDRFQFPGLGVFFILFFALINPTYLKKILKQSLSQFPWLFYLLLGYTIFAISNHVGIGEIKFSFPLPSYILQIGNALRASDRFFWPVVYAIIFISLIVVIKSYSKKSLIVIFCLASVLQIIDTHAGWSKLHLQLNADVKIDEDSLLKNSFWMEASNHYDNIILAPAQNSPENWRIFGLYAAKMNKGTNAVYLARIDKDKLDKVQSSLEKGQIQTNNFYVIEKNFLPDLLSNLNFQEDLLTKIDNFIVLAPKWKECIGCKQNYDPLNLDEFFVPTYLNKEIIFTKEAGIDNRYLLNGWSKFIEDWGVWSDASESQLILPTPKNSNARGLKLRLRAFINQTQLNQAVKVYINGMLALETTLDSFENNTLDMVLPKIALEQGYVAIRMVYTNAASPAKTQAGADSRLLAIGLKSAIFY